MMSSMAIMYSYMDIPVYIPSKYTPVCRFYDTKPDLELMPLLTLGNLPKLLLGDTLHQPIHTRKHLGHVLRVESGDIGVRHELLDAQEAVADEMGAELVIHLLQHPGPEPIVGSRPGTDV